jgi:hypothetical integral membrane protein (TIGR02206 family)
VSQFGNPSHLVALVGTILAALLIVPMARLRPGWWLTALCWSLGVFLIVNEAGYEVTLAARGQWSADRALPCYLCDAAAFVAGLALITGDRRLAEVTWFWAIAGTLQGLITPDQVLTFPSYDWLQFYGDHGGVVLAALILVIGRGLHPRPGAIPRVLAVTVGFTIAAAVTDLVTGGNYMYLRQVPGSGSLLSLMGPWPWYIVSTTVLAVILITALDAPFWRERRIAAAAAPP